MARLGLTYEQVADAADGLINSGTAVTVQTLRDKLGSGSYSTLSKHLTAWKEKQEQAGKLDIPEMPANVDQAFGQVWAVVWKATQEEVKAEREALEATRKGFEAEKKELLAEVEKLEQEKEQAESELEKSTEALADEKEKSALLEKEKTVLQIENAGLSEKCKAVSALEAQVKELQAQLVEIAKASSGKSGNTGK